MPKPHWGWFAVAVVAVASGVLVVSAGWSAPMTGSGPPGGLLVAGLGLLAVWAFGKAFFDFRLPPRG